MGLVANLQLALSDAGNIPFTVESDVLIIPRSDENGFEIRVAETSRGNLVVCGNWHDRVYSEKDTIGLVMSALAPVCRVRTVYRGRHIVRCYIEFLKDGKWEIAGARGVLLYPFWASQREEVKSNSWLAPSEFWPTES